MIHLEIVTPDRLFFSGDVDSVDVPGIKGYMGILPGHAPLLSELKVGIVTYRQGGSSVRLFSDHGFVEVLPDKVSVLVVNAEKPEEIDVEQARQEQDRAQQLLQSKEATTDFKDALLRLEKSVARLEVARAA